MIGWVHFRRNIFTFDKTITNKRFVLDTLLLTNVLYSPLSFTQWRTAVLSDHTHIFFTLSLLRQVLKFSAYVPLLTRGVV